MPALVDFPLPEAEALLKRLGPDGISMTAAECDAAERARARIEQAVKVERGVGGSEAETIQETAERLLGYRVRVVSSYGTTYTGKLERLVGYRSLMILEGDRRHPINCALVESIEVEQPGRSAA